MSFYIKKIKQIYKMEKFRIFHPGLTSDNCLTLYNNKKNKEKLFSHDSHYF